MRKKVDFCIVFNSAGQMIGVERPPWTYGGPRRQNLMWVPQNRFSGHSESSGFLWGHSAYALGIGRSSVSQSLKTNDVSFHAFKTFHRVALGHAKGGSLAAFQLFLQAWDPAQAAMIDALTDVAGGTLVFRFHYENCFLHESHSARVIWARLLRSAEAGDRARV